MSNRYFDERQLKIRGGIFFRGLIATFALLFINAILLANDIVWASGFHQNIVIGMVVSNYILVEAILRDAFFGMGQMRWPIIGTFGVISIVLIYSNVSIFLLGNPIVEDGMLSIQGVMLIYTVNPVSVTIAGLVKEIIEKRNNKD